jgi:hypothetical protein
MGFLPESTIAKRLLTFVIAVMVVPLPLVAQSDRGTVMGSVIDPSGAVIPAAEVLAINVDTGVSTRTATNTVGLYTLSTFQSAGTKFGYRLLVSERTHGRALHSLSRNGSSRCRSRNWTTAGKHHCHGRRFSAQTR